MVLRHRSAREVRRTRLDTGHWLILAQKTQAGMGQPGFDEEQSD